MNPQQHDRTGRDLLLRELPLAHRRLDVGGCATSVLEGGAGTPVVLLHGGIHAGGAVWWRVLPSLIERHRVVVPDLPGLGESAPLPQLHANAVAGWLSELLERTCSEQPTLVAHSAPGGLAARWTAQHARSLRRLVLVDAAGLARFRPPPGVLPALLRSQLRPSVANAERFLDRVAADLGPVRAAAPAQWAAFLEYVASRSRVPAARRSLRQLVKAGSAQLPDDLLQATAVPVGLLWGRHDPLIPLTVAEAASTRTGWPLRIIEKAGHLPHVEQPEAFIDALADLIDRS